MAHDHKTEVKVASIRAMLRHINVALDDEESLAKYPLDLTVSTLDELCEKFKPVDNPVEYPEGKGLLREEVFESRQNFSFRELDPKASSPLSKVRMGVPYYDDFSYPKSYEDGVPRKLVQSALIALAIAAVNHPGFKKTGHLATTKDFMSFIEDHPCWTLYLESYKLKIMRDGAKFTYKDLVTGAVREEIHPRGMESEFLRGFCKTVPHLKDAPQTSEEKLVFTKLEEAIVKAMNNLTEPARCKFETMELEERIRKLPFVLINIDENTSMSFRHDPPLGEATKSVRGTFCVMKGEQVAYEDVYLVRRTSSNILDLVKEAAKYVNKVVSFNGIQWNPDQHNA